MEVGQRNRRFCQFIEYSHLDKVDPSKVEVVTHGERARFTVLLPVSSEASLALSWSYSALHAQGDHATPLPFDLLPKAGSFSAARGGAQAADLSVPLITLLLAPTPNRTARGRMTLSQSLLSGNFG